MKTKAVKTMLRGGILALAAVMLFSLMVGAGGMPSEPIAAAEGRGYAMVHIDGVPGSWQSSPYEGHIKVIDLNFSVANIGNAGDPGDPSRSKPQFSEITIVKEFDQTSPTLSFYCATGEHIVNVQIKMLPAGGPTEPEYYIITLEDAVITKIESRMVYRESDQTYVHLEEVSFKCAKIHWMDIMSGIMAGWDLVHDEPL